MCTNERARLCVIKVLREILFELLHRSHGCIGIAWCCGYRYGCSCCSMFNACHQCIQAECLIVSVDSRQFVSVPIQHTHVHMHIHQRPSFEQIFQATAPTKYSTAPCASYRQLGAPLLGAASQQRSGFARTKQCATARKASPTQAPPLPVPQ
jgi:hypothetical protein